uniref:EF-hand domain-containing protein n=1 Tax=Panagrolaimus sp. JU765 TaxID=591449 RepID=A0AC34Q4C6_9BILA
KFKDEKKLEQFVEMLNHWKMEGVSASEALRKFSETKGALRDINKALTDRAKQQSTSRSTLTQATDRSTEKITEEKVKKEVVDEIREKNDKKNRDETPTPTSQHNSKVTEADLSDSGDYTSVFIDDHNGELGSYDAPYESDRRTSADIESERAPHMFTITRKGLVMQKRDGTDASIGHVFTLSEVRTIQIQAYVNSKLDPDLKRFENAMVGILQSSDGGLIITTTRKDGRKITTDRCTLLPGTYVFYVKFCRRQQLRARKPFDPVYDDKTGKLSSKYRVCVMNIFDMFDFNDDQVLDIKEFKLYNLLNGSVLDIKEFKLYNLLNGSGLLTDDLWEALIKTFDNRDNGLTMKAFVDMHQYELDSYDDKTELKDMWFSLNELGFDEHFQLAETCPIFVEYHSTDDEVFIDKYDTEFWEKTNQKDLLEFYWNFGEKIPYMKEYSLKLWSCEYFAVLIAGPTSEPTRYHLRLDGSKNVNLDVDKSMIIDKTVSPNVLEILLVGIVVDCSRDWFISVRRVSKISTASTMTPISG